MHAAKQAAAHSWRKSLTSSGLQEGKAGEGDEGGRREEVGEGEEERAAMVAGLGGREMEEPLARAVKERYGNNDVLCSPLYLAYTTADCNYVCLVACSM